MKVSRLYHQVEQFELFLVDNSWTNFLLCHALFCFLFSLFEYALERYFPSLTRNTRSPFLHNSPRSFESMFSFTGKYSNLIQSPVFNGFVATKSSCIFSKIYSLIQTTIIWTTSFKLPYIIYPALHYFISALSMTEYLSSENYG